MPYSIEDIYQTGLTFDGAHNMIECPPADEIEYHEAAVALIQTSDDWEELQLSTTFILTDEQADPSKGNWFKATLPYEFSYHSFAQQLVQCIKEHGCRLELQDLAVDIDKDSIEIGLIRITDAEEESSDEMEFDIIFRVHPNIFAQYISKNIEIDFT